MALNKFERALFYPVTVIATVFAAQAWFYQGIVLAGTCSIVVILLWILPLFKSRGEAITRIVFWFASFALSLVIAWLALWWLAQSYHSRSVAYVSVTLGHQILQTPLRF